MNHQTVLALVSALWVALELMVGIVSRRSGVDRSAHDRGSYTLLWTLLIATTFAGGFLQHQTFGQMPERDALFWLGISLIVIGMIIRATAILTLRRFFTVQVTIQESHELIERGLYRIIRHPSYTGALLSFIGLGFAFGNWLSLALVLAGALIGLGYRIRVEEATLTNHFGERYRAYAARTKRLIPGIY